MRADQSHERHEARDRYRRAGEDAEGEAEKVPLSLTAPGRYEATIRGVRAGQRLLRAKLYDAERQKAEDERAEARRDQVGSGDRSQRIRTYNFPQGRVTDHRINLTLYKLDRIMEGEGLDEIVAALITDHQASQLAAMEDG